MRRRQRRQVRWADFAVRRHATAPHFGHTAAAFATGRSARRQPLSISRHFEWPGPQPRAMATIFMRVYYKDVENHSPT